jgi:tetratricopeptide (TPR) repeat protein
MLAEDPDAAEAVLRSGYELLEQAGAKPQRQVVGSYLARTLVMQERYEDAERLASTIEELDPTGIAEIALARCARGRAAAHLGRVGEGEQLAREGVALIERTDFLLDRADARLDLADVLRLASRKDEAAGCLTEACRLHVQKGNDVSAGKTRALLAKLGSGS